MATNHHHRSAAAPPPRRWQIIFSSIVMSVGCLMVVFGGGGYQTQSAAVAPRPLRKDVLSLANIFQPLAIQSRAPEQPTSVASAEVEGVAGFQYFLVSTTQDITDDKPSTPDPQQFIEASDVHLPKQLPRQSINNARPVTNRQFRRLNSEVPRLKVATLPEESPSTPVEPIQRVENKPLDLQRDTWPECPLMQRQLKQLETIEVLAIWAAQTQKQLWVLHRARGFDSVESVVALAELRKLQAEGIQKAAAVTDMEQQTALFKTLNGLKRRLAIWHAVQAIISNQHNASKNTQDPRKIVAAALKDIDVRINGSPERDNWSVYLMLATLRQYTAAEAVLDAGRRTKDAQRILTRMHSNYLTPDQLELLAEKPFAALERGLRYWCAEPIDYAQLLTDIEQFEAGRFSYQAEPVAAGFQAIRWSADKPVAELGTLLEQHYRSGNIRIRIAEDLVNRLLPAQSHRTQDIDDRVSGARVTGTSQSTSQLNVRLHADGLRWVIGVEAAGNIQTQTTSQKGAATFKNETVASFQTAKQMFISPSGIEFGTTTTEIDSENKLIEFTTDYDSSLFSGLARNMAKKQYRQKEKQSTKELEQRIRNQATSALDDKVTTGVNKVNDQFTSRWLEPMRQLELSPVATQLSTTENQLIVDYRLAGADQLAAFGYRPEITGDSLVSIQVHESAMNNLLHKLALDGTSGKLRDVMAAVAEQLGFSEYQVPSEIADSVTIKLTTRDAIRIRFYRGRIQLLMQLKELRNNRVDWDNFAVLVEFYPQENSINGNLKREGVIQIIGRGLRLGDRIALQTIFNKIIPSTRTISLLGSGISDHPNFADTRISAFQVQNGWLTYCIAAGSLLQTADREAVEKENR